MTTPTKEELVLLLEGRLRDDPAFRVQVRALALEDVESAVPREDDPGEASYIEYFRATTGREAPAEGTTGYLALVIAMRRAWTSGRLLGAYRSLRCWMTAPEIYELWNAWERVDWEAGVAFSNLRMDARSILINELDPHQRLRILWAHLIP